MSLRLTKPGMRSVDLSGKKHPITGLPLEPLGYLKNGTAVWPQFGAAPDDEDPDDPTFTGEDEDDEDDDEDEDEDEKKPKKRPSKKSKDDDEDDDDDEDEDELPAKARASRQAMKYRLQAKKLRQQNADLEARLQAIEDKDKKPEELNEREVKEARQKAEKLAADRAALQLENAFLRVNLIDWVDPEDALFVADREGLLEDVIDEDGNVDRKSLRAALKDLARRKPHLVKKPKPVDDEDEEDEEPRPRRSAATMNSRRKGTKQTPSREDLAKKFPVLRR